MVSAVQGVWYGLLTIVSLLCPIQDRKLPEWPSAPAVEPKSQDPAPVNLLDREVLYVVQSDGEEQLLASPDGVVSVVALKGPVLIYGRFADSAVRGKAEQRMYQAKTVFVVERVRAGSVELLKVPQGVVSRRTLGDGMEPNPPKPDPPRPDPSIDPALLRSLTEAYAREIGPTRPADVTALAGAMEGAARTAADPTLKTWGQMVVKVNRDTVASMGTGKLPIIGPAIGDWLNATTGHQSPNAALTDELRARAAGAYRVLAATLKAVPR